MIGMWPTLLSGAGAAAAGAVLYGSLWPGSRLLAPVIAHGPREAPARVAMTFDDGPHPQATPAILDILARLDAKAAFFVIGAHAQRHPQLLRRIDEAGHLIGNHSYDHAYHGMFHGRRYWADQLQRTGRVIEDAIGKRPRLFRPPMGFKHPPMAQAAKQADCAMVTWTRRGRDGWPVTSAQILRRLTHRTRAGDILTLHDGTDSHHSRRDLQPTVDAIEPLITCLRSRGLTLDRLDRLIGVPGYASKM